MSQSNAAGGSVTESTYELPPFTEAVEAVMKHKHSSIQETLDRLANNGYYLVRRKASK